MKKQTIIGVIAIIAIIAAVILAGCVEEEAAETTPTGAQTPAAPTTTPASSPTLSVEEPPDTIGNSSAS
jgi:PBP1b-binding outer membrane lipoprotein LpoB